MGGNQEYIPKGLLVPYWDNFNPLEVTPGMRFLDPLGFINRETFNIIRADLYSKLKSENKHHSLIILDIDNFKAINDSRGQDGGDDFLVERRQILEEMLAKFELEDTGSLFRIGGDEFGLLFSQELDLEDLVNISKYNNSKYVEIGKNKFTTYSMGYSSSMELSGLSHLLKEEDFLTILRRVALEEHSTFQNLRSSLATYLVSYGDVGKILPFAEHTIMTVKKIRGIDLSKDIFDMYSITHENESTLADRVYASYLFKVADLRSKYSKKVGKAAITISPEDVFSYDFKSQDMIKLTSQQQKMNILNTQELVKSGHYRS